MRLKRTGDRSIASETESDPALHERQDVEMLQEASDDSASVTRGPDAVADNEERATLRLQAEGKRGQKHDFKTFWNLEAKTKARLEPRRGQKRESTRLLPVLEEEVTSTVPVASGSAPGRLELEC